MRENKIIDIFEILSFPTFYTFANSLPTVNPLVILGNALLFNQIQVVINNGYLSGKNNGRGILVYYVVEVIIILY